MILRGRNVYPVDLEETLRASHPLVRPGGVAVFSVEVDSEHGEGVVAYLEVVRGEERMSAAQQEDICASARKAVSGQKCGIVRLCVLLETRAVYRSIRSLGIRM